MKLTKSLPLSALCLVAALAPALAQTPPPPDCVFNSDPLPASPYYDALTTTEVQFHPDAAFVIGSLPDGSIAVRYGATQAAALAADAPALQCRCIEPTVCIENTCAITGTGTGNAKCRGGCYRANGDACVSCRFFAVTTTSTSTPPPTMPPAKDSTPVKSSTP